MKQWKYLDEGMKITLYHYRQKKSGRILHHEGHSSGIQRCGWLVQSIKHEPCSDEWRLFIDSSKVSLKAVLLHNGNVLPSIPVAHAFGIKESYDSMKQGNT